MNKDGKKSKFCHPGQYNLTDHSFTSLDQGKWE